MKTKSFWKQRGQDVHVRCAHRKQRDGPAEVAVFKTRNFSDAVLFWLYLFIDIMSNWCFVNGNLVSWVRDFDSHISITTRSSSSTRSQNNGRIFWNEHRIRKWDKNCLSSSIHSFGDLVRKVVIKFDGDIYKNIPRTTGDNFFIVQKLKIDTGLSFK